MKHLFIFVLSVFSIQAYAQSNVQLETYQLENGFKVYLLPDKNATTTFGAVAVNAGSKNDPADATGLAHYLEHLLFKGTTTMGTKDYEKEKPYLDSITIYYQQLKKTTDEAKRTEIKALINKQAVEASKYGLPTEFHGLLTSIGGTEINAFTQTDMTVYHNSFPGEQMEKWLDLYSARFQNPVFRSFQSELEVVYEEKNRGSDNFAWTLMEKLNSKLYPNHPYGTQTTIGTSEHLKNPPIDRIYEFFNTYYVANNMALILSGNFDVESTKALIKSKFSALRTGTIPAFPAYEPTQFTKNEVEEIRVSPIKLDILGWKSVPTAHADEVALNVCNYLLFNSSQTGFLNKLQLDGKIQAAFAVSMHQHDDGAELLIVVPKIVGQSFEKAEALVFAEINKVMEGDFSDELLKNIKAEMIQARSLEFEDPKEVGLKVLTIFNTGKDWEYISSYNEKVNTLTKEDIIRVAKKYYGANHYTIHSKTGFPKKDKLEKPNFKPVVANQSESSVYAKNFEKIGNNEVKGKYLDFSKDAETKDLGQNNKLFVVKNPYNNVASLSIRYYVGTENLPNTEYLAAVLAESAPKGMTVEEFRKKLSELNSFVSYEAEKDFFRIDFQGKEENLGAALKLVQELFANPVANESALKNLADGYTTNFKQEKKDPATMGKILRDYALYGAKSEYKDRLGVSAIKKITEAQLWATLKEVQNYAASFHYCGNQALEKVATDIQMNYTPGNTGKPAFTDREIKAPSKNTIYIVNDAKARQNQIYFSIPSSTYQSKDDAYIALFNQYMGGSFSGIILQEIREYRSLAYSAGGRIVKPQNQGKALFFTSYVGCQADKSNEAIDIMMGLINDMPKHPERMNTFKSYVSSTASTDYPNHRDRSEKIEDLQIMGFSSDPKTKETEAALAASFEDLYKFYEKTIQNKPIVITIYGDKSKMDLEKLKKYGEIVELKASEIATY